MSEMSKGSGHSGTLDLVPVGCFLSEAEGQGEDHCSESWDKWVGSAGPRACHGPLQDPSFLICKLGVMMPGALSHGVEQMITTGHIRLFSSSSYRVSDLRNAPLYQCLPDPAF